MAKVHRLAKSIVVLVENPTDSFGAWARLMGAYNVVTRSVMPANLTESGTKAIEGVVWEGCSGWHDSIAETMTVPNLKELADLGEYDPAIVLEYAAQRKGLHTLRNLEKILDAFGRTLAKSGRHENANP